MSKNMKKIMMVAVVLIGALIFLAVIFAVLNATVLKGKWSLWIDYRYDDTDYEIGSGSVPSGRVERIDLDWIDGSVTVVSCEDAYISLTESAAEEIPEASQLRWHLDEDGKTLTVKYRKSSQFFGFGSAKKDKDLILRVPERLFGALEISIHVNSTKVRVDGIEGARLDFTSQTGELKVRGGRFETVCAESEVGLISIEADVTERVELTTEEGNLELESTVCPARVKLENEEGDLILRLPADASFTLDFESEDGRLHSDFAYERQNGRYVVKDGATRFSVETEEGDLFLIVGK